MIGNFRETLQEKLFSSLLKGLFKIKTAIVVIRRYLFGYNDLYFRTLARNA